MAFIFVFMLLTFAVPLSVEIYRRGSDNLVTRASEEAVNSKFVKKTLDLVGNTKNRARSFGVGLIGLAVGSMVLLTAVDIVLSFLLRIISLGFSIAASLLRF